MGFWPYLRHEYSSAGMSATLGLIAGTRIVRFTRCFLRIPVRLELDPIHSAAEKQATKAPPRQEKRYRPALRAVAAPAVSTVLAAGDVLRVRVVVALALLRRTGGRRLRAAGRAGRRWEHEERRASRAPVRHAPVPGRHRRQERRARAGHAEPGVPAVTGHRLGEVQRQGPRGGSRRRLRGLGGGRSLRLRLRPRRHGATPEPRVPRAVQDGDHLLELGHRHVRELPAVNLLLDLLQLLLLLALRLYRRWGRRPLPGASLGELQDETLHPAQPRRGGLLDGHLLVHPPVPSHQIEGRHLRRRRPTRRSRTAEEEKTGGVGGVDYKTVVGGDWFVAGGRPGLVLNGLHYMVKQVMDHTVTSKC
jgi:hypothetical protein